VALPSLPLLKDQAFVNRGTALVTNQFMGPPNGQLQVLIHEGYSCFSRPEKRGGFYFGIKDVFLN